MAALKVRQEGDRCLVVDLGDTMDEATGLRCLVLAQRLRALNLAGVRDIVATYRTLAVHYVPRPELGVDPVATLTQKIQTLLSTAAPSDQRLAPRVIRIPVCYGDEHGPDLKEASELAGVSQREFTKLHHGTPLRVYMLGFAPGQPYIGIHDEALALPRRNVPRTLLPAGSLGVANRQTTIYPNELPGGWHIIGAVPIPLFEPQADSPTLLLPGDEVHFEPITSREFAAIRKDPTSWSVRS